MKTIETALSAPTPPVPVMEPSSAIADPIEDREMPGTLAVDGDSGEEWTQRVTVFADFGGDSVTPLDEW